MFWPSFRRAVTLSLSHERLQRTAAAVAIGDLSPSPVLQPRRMESSSEKQRLLIAAGEVRIVIEPAFMLDRAVDALDHIAHQHVHGKVVLTVGQ